MPSEKSRFLLLVLAAILLMLALNWVSAPLTTPAAPLGIFSYELARRPAVAQAILDSWDERTQLHAAFGLGLDYLFMLAYGAAISTACLKAGRALQAWGWPLARLGPGLAAGVWLAVGLDATENVALTVMLLNGRAAGLWPGVAWLCALLKFALIFMGLVYTFFAGAAGLAARLPAAAPGGSQH